MQINITNRICKFYNSLTKSQKLKTENVLFDGKDHKGMLIYFTNYVSSKSIKKLSLNLYTTYL